MGVCHSPDIAQEIMELILCDILDKVFINDITCFSQCFKSHMKFIGTVLSRLMNKGILKNVTDS